jgi:hypothetical protein
MPGTLNVLIATGSVRGCYKKARQVGEGLGVPRQIPPDRGPADINAELEQFAMNARRADGERAR